jgi:hypothetical protein
VLHTGNRVDAVLGTQVFRHMLRLHLRYFEHRPTGVLIARVRQSRPYVSSWPARPFPSSSTAPSSSFSSR